MARPPASLHDFIGQPRVVAHLRDVVAGAKARGEAVPSILFIGRAGMGKTALAEATAREYGGDTSTDTSSCFRRIMAGPRVTKGLIEILGGLQHGDLLFVDEMHALDREAQELLHLALDERRTFGLTPRGAPDRTKLNSIAEFTLVGATTEPGRITKALRSRMHAVQLDSYSMRELKAIAEKVAEGFGLSMTPQGARHLAERSQRTPRSIRKLLELLAVTTPVAASVTQEDVRRFMTSHGIDDLGLDAIQRQLLELLGGARRVMSLEVLAAKLGVDARFVKTELEPLLLDLGLLDLGPRGRSLTAAGRRLVGDTMAAADASGDRLGEEVEE